MEQKRKPCINDARLEKRRINVEIKYNHLSSFQHKHDAKWLCFLNPSGLASQDSQVNPQSSTSSAASLAPVQAEGTQFTEASHLPEFLPWKPLFPRLFVSWSISGDAFCCLFGKQIKNTNLPLLVFESYPNGSSVLWPAHSHSALGTCGFFTSDEAVGTASGLEMDRLFNTFVSVLWTLQHNRYLHRICIMLSTYITQRWFTRCTGYMQTLWCSLSIRNFLN